MNVVQELVRIKKQKLNAHLPKITYAGLHEHLINQ